MQESMCGVPVPFIYFRASLGVKEVCSRQNFRLLFFYDFYFRATLRGEGSIAIVKIFDFDFFMIFHSTSLPESKNVF